MDAVLPDFQTFRRPCSYQKWPLVVHWLLSLLRKPKVVTLYKHKFARDLRGDSDFALDIACKVKLSLLNQTNLETFLAIVFCGRLARRSVVLLLWQWKHWALYAAERRLLHRAVPCLLKRRWEVWTLWSFGSIVLWKKVLNLFCWFSTTDNSQSDEVRHVFFLETLIMFYICLKMC